MSASPATSAAGIRTKLTYEQRMEFNRNSVVKKALLESLRLTGKEEAGDWEAEVTVRVTDNAAGDTVMNRTLYLNDKMLRHMVPGKYIDISVCAGQRGRFRYRNGYSHEGRS